jgi:hypothetical protein
MAAYSNRKERDVSHAADGTTRVEAQHGRLRLEHTTTDQHSSGGARSGTVVRGTLQKLSRESQINRRDDAVNWQFPQRPRRPRHDWFDSTSPEGMAEKDDRRR